MNNNRNYAMRSAEKEEVRAHPYKEGNVRTLHSFVMKESHAYALLSRDKVAFPLCDTAQDSYSLYCATKGIWDTCTKVHELPSCSKDVMEILLSEGTGWRVVPVLSTLLRCVPIKSLSPMEQEAIRDKRRASRNVNATHKKKVESITLELDLTLL